MAAVYISSFNLLNVMYISSIQHVMLCVVWYNVWALPCCTVLHTIYAVICCLFQLLLFQFLWLLLHEKRWLVTGLDQHQQMKSET